jgi:hypothetical protein
MIDHIVYGVLDLASGVADLERRLGVRATPGGKHLGRGTHNALLGLGGEAYLEIIARDPDQQPSPARLHFDLHELAEPKLVGWAVRTHGIDGFVERARRAGYDPGAVEDMSRTRPDGARLSWRVAQGPPAGRDLVVPFVIDWLDTPHPFASVPGGVTLARLSAVHPDPESVRPALDALGAAITVVDGAEPALVAVLDTPRGRVELR